MLEPQAHGQYEPRAVAPFRPVLPLPPPQHLQQIEQRSGHFDTALLTSLIERDQYLVAQSPVIFSRARL